MAVHPTNSHPNDPPAANIRDLSVPIHQLPTWVVALSVVLLVVPLLPFIVLHGAAYFLAQAFGLLTLPLFIALIIAHELTHAIGWKVTSGLPWSAFRFGIAWRALAPYCHATQPMPVAAYRIGAVLPVIITGVLPLVVGTLSVDATLTFLSGLMIMAAVGDIFVLWSLRDVPAAAQVQDHPTNAGCIVYLP